MEVVALPTTASVPVPDATVLLNWAQLTEEDLSLWLARSVFCTLLQDRCVAPLPPCTPFLALLHRSLVSSVASKMHCCCCPCWLFPVGLFPRCAYSRSHFMSILALGSSPAPSTSTGCPPTDPAVTCMPVPQVVGRCCG